MPALLELLGAGARPDVVVTAADCLATGQYDCAECAQLGFDTSCVCPIGGAGGLGRPAKVAAAVLVAAAETCTWYDPRAEPWYVQAATGPKDVVVVIDVSGSMTAPRNSIDESPLDIAKKAAKAVLNTLTSADRVQIVAFSTAATSPGTELIYATEGHKISMRAFIDSLNPVRSPAAVASIPTPAC